MPVPAELRVLLHRGVEIGDLTGGAFDVTWAALWGLWDFEAAEPRVPEAAEIARRVALIDYRQVEIDDAAGTVRLPRAGMKIGLGGIAKGYALDRAAAALDARGVGSYLLLAGGQVFARGRKGDRPWRGDPRPRGGRTTLRQPRLSDPRPRPAATTRATSCSTASATTTSSTRAPGCRPGGCESATVLAADATLADALSTALMVLGRSAGRRWRADPRRGGSAGRASGRMVATPGVAGRLTILHPPGASP